jgi:dimeric dUTPase (all-alpha-NTP-PPase superfamily)
MDFKKLFNLQKQLDTRILNEHNLQGNRYFSQKTLALQVEIGELANETRCFKYWSNKGPSEKQTILEEFVDCLHFILSIGLDKNYDDIQPKAYDDCIDVTEQFLSLFVDVNDLLTCGSKDDYKTLFNDFLTLGKILNFSEEDIENAYLRKNNINHDRQTSGY